MTKIKIFKRIIPSILKKIFRIIKKNKFIIRFKNIYLEINIHEPMDQMIFFFNKYEELQTKILTKNIKEMKPHIFLDIGANSGLYSLIIAKQFSKLKVYAFEPIEESFLKLKKNINLNKLKNKINIYNFGLSDKNQQLKMNALKKNNYIQLGGYGILRGRKKNISDKLHICSAQFKKGDDIFYFKNKIIFCKIDVEGHELNVLHGIKKLLANNKIFFQIEIFDKEYKKVNNFLKKNNFKEINKIFSDNKFDYYYKNF